MPAKTVSAAGSARHLRGRNKYGSASKNSQKGCRGRVSGAALKAVQRKFLRGLEASGASAGPFLPALSRGRARQGHARRDLDEARRVVRKARSASVAASMM